MPSWLTFPWNELLVQPLLRHDQERYQGCKSSALFVKRKCSRDQSNHDSKSITA